MDTQPVRILGIAPYAGLQTALARAAAARPDIILDVRHGDMEEGVRIVREASPEDYDAIISRGGTAALIRGITELPVIEIELSLYDVLHSIRLAQTYGDHYAILGYPNITEPAHTLCSLMNYDVEIITIHSMQETLAALAALHDKGCRMVICDMAAHTAATQMGMTPFLITSGVESLNASLEQACIQARTFRHLRRDNLFLRHLVEYEGDTTIVLQRDGVVYYSRPEYPSDSLLQALRTRIADIPNHASLHFYYLNKGTLNNVSAHIITFDHVNYYVFHLQSSQLPMRGEKLGIRSLNRTECEFLFTNSFFSVSGAMGELEQTLEKIADTRQTVMIFGQTGTGKEQIARSIYLRSSMSNKPFVVVNCAVMDERSWDFLFSHHSSPLNGRGSTIYFQNLESMPQTRLHELMAAMLDTGITRRQRLIFSCSCLQGVSTPEIGRRFATELGMFTLHLPTLRSRTDEIPSLAALYLNRLNAEAGRNISGFEPAAIVQLRQYDWPGNYTQFKHVLHDLVTLQTSSYILSSTTAELLAKERTLFRSPLSSEAGVAIANRSMDEICRDAAEQTVAALGGNRSLAARSLGISRTTLWRLLGSSN